MFDATEVLASGLSAARQRVNALATNIANAQTTRTPEGGPFKKRQIVQMAIPQESSFTNTLDRMTLARPQVQGIPRPRILGGWFRRNFSCANGRVARLNRFSHFLADDVVDDNVGDLSQEMSQGLKGSAS